ncbi:MAG: hypothetical protein HQK70_01265 [Desulfamplus sp.]|nr:hypothetical protein [Desulfamplus sp.]
MRLFAIYCTCAILALSCSSSSYSEVLLTYPRSCDWVLFSCKDDTSLPATPSLEHISYISTLYQWAVANNIQISFKDVELYIDKPAYKKEALNNITFEVTVDDDGNTETFDFINLDNYRLIDQMRDIIFLESMQSSINKWETDYITGLKAGDEFADIFDQAIKIFEEYRLYTGKQGFSESTNPILNSLLGAGNTSYGNLFAADGTVEDFAESTFAEASSAVFDEGSWASGLKTILIKLRDPKTYGNFAKEFTKDLVLNALVENKVISDSTKMVIKNMFTVSSTIGGVAVETIKYGGAGIGLIMAPGKLYYETFSYFMDTHKKASTAAYFTFYYYLMDKHSIDIDTTDKVPAPSSYFFSDDGHGLLKPWGVMDTYGSICNEFTSEIDKTDNVAALLCQTGNYKDPFNYGWLSTTPEQSIYAESIANLFLFIKGININELKTKVAQQVALEKARDNPAPPPTPEPEPEPQPETTYGTVTSPYTGRVWLDRNLGASHACTSYNDSECYGDYYQWGRNADGHEKANSQTTTTLATDINNAGNKFITGNFGWVFMSLNSNEDLDNYKKTFSLRSQNWSKTNGCSVCPVGFRVPTIDEFKDEFIHIMDTYSNFLMLPLASMRRGNGIVDSIIDGYLGNYWTSSYEDINGGIVSIFGGKFSYHYASDIYGLAVRCIKDTSLSSVIPVTNAGADQTVLYGTSVALDASESVPNCSPIVSYQWKEGNTILSESIQFSKADFSVGTHVITLVVTNSIGEQSTDTVIITVNPTDSIQPTISINKIFYKSPNVISTEVITNDDKEVSRTSFAIYDYKKRKIDISSLISASDVNPSSTFNSDPTALTWGYDPATLNTTTSWDIDISGLLFGKYYIKFFATDGVNHAVETSYIGFTNAPSAPLPNITSLTACGSDVKSDTLTFEVTLSEPLPAGYGLFLNFDDQHGSWLVQNTPGGHKQMLNQNGNVYYLDYALTQPDGRFVRSAIFHLNNDNDPTNDFLASSWSETKRCECYYVPTITTRNITNITTTSVFTGGNILSNGGTPITEGGVCWNTTSNPTIADNKTTEGAVSGSFSSNITGLTPSTTYYVRAYATNSVGTAYGDQSPFTTESNPPPPPPVVTPTAINTDTQIVTSGTVINSGEHEDVTVGAGAAVTNSGTLTNLNNSGTINGGVVAGDSVNDGVMNNVTLPQETALDNAGGTLSNADNAGEVFGGTIEGTVTNTGVISGTTPDGVIDASYTVTISESATVSGGEVAGAVANNGVLDSVKIGSNAIIAFGNSGKLTGTITIVDDEGVGCVITIPPHVVYPDKPFILTPRSILNYAKEQSWDVKIEERRSRLQRNSFAASSTLPQVQSYYYLIDGVVFSETGSKSTEEIDMVVPFNPDNVPSVINTSDLIVLVYDYQSDTWKTVVHTLDGNNVKIKTDLVSAVAIVAEANLLVSVITDQVSSISHISAASGGTVVSEGGSTISAKGVCWNTASNPTIENNKTDEGTGAGSFKSILTKFSPNTKYYVRAYVTSELGTIYGSEYSFTTAKGLVNSYLTLTDKTLAAFTIPTNANMNMFGVSVGKSIKIKQGSQVAFNYFVANNKVVLEESWSQFRVYRSGATVYLVSILGTVINIPATLTAQSIYFNDGRADLVIYGNKVMLGDQEITLSANKLSTLGNSEKYVDTQISQLASTVDSYLVLTNSSPAFTIPYGAYTQVFGSSGINTLSIEKGAKADCENFAGANVLNIAEAFTAFNVSRKSATVYFEGQNGTYIEIPATTTFQALNFQDNSYKLAIVDSQIMLIKMIIDKDKSKYDVDDVIVISDSVER